MKVFVILLVIVLVFVANPVFAPPPGNVPDKVTNLSATAVSKSQINLSWDEPNDNGFPITGYKIERNEGPWITIVENTGSTETTYSDTGLEQDTRYQYRVSAINSEGIGQASTADSATTFGLPTKPIALEATPGNTQVSLSWKEPVSARDVPITDYEIEYSNNNGNSWIVFDDGISTITQTTITNLENNKNYLFRVYAINSVGKGPFAETSAMPVAVTDSDYSRSPPKILGFGFYNIILQHKTDPYSKISLGLKVDDIQGFKDFIPYSQHSDVLDMQNYGGFENYDKHGQYIFLNDVYIIPTFAAKVGEPVQLQIRLKDQYASTKIEHLGLYTGLDERNEISSAKLKLIWDKGQPLDVIDKDKLLSDVKFNTALEDGQFWAIIDLVFDKEMKKSDIMIEAWNEQRKPAIKKMDDALESVNKIEYHLPDKPTYHVEVEMTHDTSNPVCKASSTCFIPYNAKILEEGVVSWKNTDVFLHDIESGTPGKIDHRFDLHILPGETVEKRFENAGIYNYFCRLHPWAQGIVTVSSKDPTVDEPLYDETKPALLVASESSGGSIMIENRDSVILPNKDLRVEISGHIQEKKGKQHLTIIITKPDGTTNKISTQTNDRGHYSIPAVLNKGWLEGDYTVSTLYKNEEIASIQFVISDSEEGFGGKLISITDEFQKGIQKTHQGIISIAEFEEWLVEHKFNESAIDYVKKRILFFK